MNRLALAGLSPFILTVTAFAQTAESPPMDHATHHGHDMSEMQMPSAPSTPADPHAGHAMQGMEGMAMPASGPAPGPESVSEPVPTSNGPVGTDRQPGNAPPPPVANDRAADHFFDPAAMARAQAALLGEHGGMVFHKVTFNLAEYQAHNGDDGYRWDASAWMGGDIDRFALKSEGEGRFGDALDHGEVQALWSHAVDPYWNVQVGVRQDFGFGPDRTYATIDIEGLAPYWFDLAAAAFISTKGEVLARLEGDIDQRLTQSLILQPRLETNFAAQDIPESRIGAGLSNMELGLRLRYELRREFAPYLGVSLDRKFGATARYARAISDPVSSTSFVAGIRFWF